MAANVAGAPALTGDEPADGRSGKRTRLDEEGNALTQVQLRPRARNCSPGTPGMTTLQAALAVWLGLDLACTHAHRGVSAPKAPLGAGAPLFIISASAVHQWLPLRSPKPFESKFRGSAGREYLEQALAHNTACEAYSLGLHQPAQSGSSAPTALRARAPFHNIPAPAYTDHYRGSLARGCRLALRIRTANLPGITRRHVLLWTCFLAGCLNRHFLPFHHLALLTPLAYARQTPLHLLSAVSYAGGEYKKYNCATARLRLYRVVPEFYWTPSCIHARASVERGTYTYICI